MIIVTVFIMLMILMNSALLHYREEEIVYNLNILSREMNDHRSFGLIGRYHLIKKRLEQGSDGADDLIAEAALQQMLVSIASDIDSKKKNTPFSLTGMVSPVVRYYIRGIAFLHGRETPADMYHGYSNPLLELSYFFERHRNWNKALLTMEKVFDGTRHPPDSAYRHILLHSGFCFAMLSRNSDARNSFYHLIDSYPESPESATARRLLVFLRVIDSGTERVLSSNSPPEVKGERLYLLSSYTRALMQLNAYFKTAATDHPSFYKSLYFRGRVFEELGKNTDAVTDYRRIASQRPRSQWALKANRRLYVIGAVYNGGNELIAQAVSMAPGYHDEGIFHSLRALHAKNQPDVMTIGEAEKRYLKLSVSGTPSHPRKVFAPAVQRDYTKQDPADIRAKDTFGLSGEVKSSIAVWYGGTSKITKTQSRIITKEGFRLKGTILNKTDKLIVLQTEYGIIKLNISKIKNIEQIK